MSMSKIKLSLALVLALSLSAPSVFAAEGVSPELARLMAKEGGKLAPVLEAMGLGKEKAEKLSEVSTGEAKEAALAKEFERLSKDPVHAKLLEKMEAQAKEGKILAKEEIRATLVKIRLERIATVKGAGKETGTLKYGDKSQTSEYAAQQAKEGKNSFDNKGAKSKASEEAFLRSEKLAKKPAEKSAAEEIDAITSPVSSDASGLTTVQFAELTAAEGFRSKLKPGILERLRNVLKSDVREVFSKGFLESCKKGTAGIPEEAAVNLITAATEAGENELQAIQTGGDRVRAFIDGFKKALSRLNGREVTDENVKTLEDCYLK